MDKLYAPWRDDYTQDVTHKKPCDLPASCVFCQQFKDQKDDHYFILARYKHHAVLLNKYPYNGGHLLIIPFEHKPELFLYAPEVQHELIELMGASAEIIKQEMQAHGINMGINQGKAAGAGIPAHVHVHILPRWNGDTNFLPTLGDTKQISTDLSQVFIKLKPHFQKLADKLK
jgi:ATP adenylyltransferase